jgi:hypothetical protein
LALLWLSLLLLLLLLPQLAVLHAQPRNLRTPVSDAVAAQHFLTRTGVT